MLEELDPGYRLSHGYPQSSSTDAAARPLQQMIATCERVCGEAEVAVSRSVALRPVVQKTLHDSLECRMRSRPHHCYTELRGFVDGAPVKAVVRADGTVVAHQALLERAQIVEALGETFDEGRIKARLDGSPLVASLTLLKGFDRILSVDYSVGGVPTSLAFKS